MENSFAINLASVIILIIFILALIGGRGYGCARLCDAYKKYKFVLAILNGARQVKAKKARASREMRNDRIAEWNHNKCWPKG